MTDGGQAVHTTPLARLGIAIGFGVAGSFVAAVLLSRGSALQLVVAAIGLSLTLVFITLVSSAERTVRLAISSRMPDLLESYGVERPAFGWIVRVKRLLRAVSDSRVAAEPTLVEHVARFRSLAWAAFALFALWVVAGFLLVLL